MMKLVIILIVLLLVSF
ncbi:type I toxin-antitoxin system Ibs family toxin, partial [Shigella flexneri]